MAKLSEGLITTTEEPIQPAPMMGRQFRQTGMLAEDAIKTSREDLRQGLLANTNMADQISGGSMGSIAPGVSQAIKQRYMRKFGIQDREFAMQLEMMADEAKQQRLNNAAQLAGEELRLNEQKRLLRRQREAARRAKRGAIMGAVLGIGGAVIGGAVGGPVGASAGYSAGSALGNMAGQGGV